MNTPQQTIALPRHIINQLLQHAQSAPDHEICGLISRDSGQAMHCHPVKNAHPSPATRYRMDGKEQIECMKSMRERGESLYAIYHSHPHSPALPSATDLAEAAYPDALYLIISLDTKGVLEMRGFYLRGESRVEEVTLQLDTF